MVHSFTHPGSVPSAVHLLLPPQPGRVVHPLRSKGWAVRLSDSLAPIRMNVPTLYSNTPYVILTHVSSTCYTALVNRGHTPSLAVPNPGEGGPLSRAAIRPDQTHRTSSPCAGSRACCAWPTKYHRYISSNSHISARKCPSNPLNFNQLQKSAHLIEQKRFQVPYFPNHAHSFPASPVLSASSQKHTGGIPPSRNSTLNPLLELKSLTPMPTIRFASRIGAL